MTWRAYISAVEPPPPTTITVLPMEDGVIPTAMVARLIRAVPPGMVTTWVDIKTYPATLHGEETVSVSLSSFRDAFAFRVPAQTANAGQDWLLMRMPQVAVHVAMMPDYTVLEAHGIQLNASTLLFDLVDAVARSPADTL